MLMLKINFIIRIDTRFLVRNIKFWIVNSINESSFTNVGFTYKLNLKFIWSKLSLIIFTIIHFINNLK